MWSLIDRVGSVIDEHQASLETLFDAEVELSEVWPRQAPQGPPKHCPTQPAHPFGGRQR